MGSIGESYYHGYPTKPLKQSGILDKFESEDVTPVIGREFPEVNIVDDLLNAPDADGLLRDLAITSKSCTVMTEKSPSSKTSSVYDS